MSKKSSRSDVIVDGQYPTTGFHDRVADFKKQLIRETLEKHDGNRTYAARELGLQRTYLQRLIRDFKIVVPVPSWCNNQGNIGKEAISD